MSYSKLLLTTALFAGAAGAAQAELKICNDSDALQSVSIGYEGSEGWKSEGWWNVDPGKCSIVVGGDLPKSYYYYRIEQDAGPFIGDGYNFCTSPKVFEIIGDTECEGRGYDIEDFAEINTNGAKSYTHRITQSDMDVAQAGGNKNKGDNGLQFCNETGQRQSITIAYEEGDGFISRGWWNVDDGECTRPIGDPLKKQYYYYRTEVKGAEYIGGTFNFCTSPEVFTIEGPENCSGRGYESEGFVELDAGTSGTSFTYTLTAELGSGGSSSGSKSKPKPEPDVVAETLTPGGVVTNSSLKLCNATSQQQGFSIGYEGPEGWTSEGWWNVDPGQCSTVLAGALDKQYYYYRAEVRGGPFDDGEFAFCTDTAAFKIVGDSNCEARGYASEDFAELDIGVGSKGYTFTLAGEEGANAGSTGSKPKPGKDTTPETPVRTASGLNFCNETKVTQSVSIGYEGPEGWTSEGWWNIDPGQCKKPLGGPLEKEYYYYRAEVEGGPFDGGEFAFCTDTSAYQIVGDSNCEARGYTSEDFAEIFVGNSPDGYTFTITDEDSALNVTPDTVVPTPDADTGNETPTNVALGLRFCNETDSTQSVSIGYEGADGWTSEGWWNVEAGKCDTALTGELTKRYYYYRAEVDAGDFSGGGFNFCTSPEAYTILGDSDCEARDYTTEDFAEIDTGGDAKGYTVTLTSETGGDTTASGLTICNSTEFTQSLSIGYEGAKGWLSEGWWNIDPEACTLVLAGALDKRYYYYRAEIDGGEFDGEDFTFCTDPSAYEIVGDTECEARGYDKEAFREIDVGAGTTSYTLTLVPPAGGDGDSTGTEMTEITGNDTAVDDMTVTGAGFEVCNETTLQQSVAFGYEGSEGWTSEGWWVVEPNACVTPGLDGERHRYTYYRAEVDGGDFTGQNYLFCTTPDAFTIVGDTDCEARGYDSEDFREVDIGLEGMFKLSLVSDAGSETVEPVVTKPVETGSTTLGDRSGTTETPDVVVAPPAETVVAPPAETVVETPEVETPEVDKAPDITPTPDTPPKNPRRSGSRG